MSYFQDMGNNETTLIARSGYSGFGATGGMLDTIGSFLKSGVKSAVDVYGSVQKGEAYKEIALEQAKQQQASSGMPSWLLPVALGGVGLVAVVMLTRKRPASNPARRHRRRRARR